MERPYCRSPSNVGFGPQSGGQVGSSFSLEKQIVMFRIKTNKTVAKSLKICDKSLSICECII